MILPVPMIVIFVLIAVCCVFFANKTRLALQNAPSAASRKGVSNNMKMMMLISFCYVIIATPNIVVVLFSFMGQINYIMAQMDVILLPAFYQLPILSRIFDSILFFVIPEFRLAVINLFHCKFSTNLA